MSSGKPTADQPSRAKRLVTWWEGWPRIAALGIGGMASLLVVAGVFQGYRLLDRIADRPTVDVPVQPEQRSWFETHPRNVLLLGSDSRIGLSEEERIPGHGFDKINAAYELGGPDLAVETVHAFTRLPIHNYIEVNLAGFENLIDLLGGIRLCVDRPMVDPLAGLSITSAGCHTLDGSEALGFARARHIIGDMRAVLNRVLAAPALLDADLITEAAASVTTDDTVTPADFVYLGSKLQDLAEEDQAGVTTFDFRVVPSEPAPDLINGVSYVLPVQPEAEEMFERLREGKPLGNLGTVLALTLPSPAQINVQARDAGDPGQTEDTVSFLRRAGFIVHDPAPAPTGYEESVILYRPGAKPNAQVVQGFFDNLQMQEAPPELFGPRTQVLVIVGPDFRTQAAP
jgi:LCP family protein required for cell wall assembly